MKKVLLIGAGDNGQIKGHFLKQSTNYDLVGFVDDTKEKGTIISGKEVLGAISDVESLYQEGIFDELFIAIAYKHLDFKEHLYNKLKSRGIPFAKYVHPSVIIDKSVKVGEGSFILAGCVVDHGVEIGNGVFINPGAVIAHDTKIGNFCFFGPSVQLAGFIDIADKSFLGINTTIIDNIKITTAVQTGASATVIENIDQPGLYVGTPAKLKKVMNTL